MFVFGIKHATIDYETVRIPPDTVKPTFINLFHISYKISENLKKNSQTNLVNLDQKKPKIKEKEQNSVTNFQLSKFNRPESTDIKGFSKSGTIEWE